MVALSTVTLIGAEVVSLPLASRARAVSVCTPLPAPRVSQGTENGVEVISAPSGAPSSRICTATTPVSSPASAATMMVPAVTAPSAGAVSTTLGGVVSAGPALTGASMSRWISAWLSARSYTRTSSIVP